MSKHDYQCSKQEAKDYANKIMADVVRNSPYSMTVLTCARKYIGAGLFENKVNGKIITKKEFRKKVSKAYRLLGDDPMYFLDINAYR